MERCVGKSEGQRSKRRKSWQRDYARANVVRWHRLRKKNLSTITNVMKNCSRFKIILTGPTIVLNEMPLHNSLASDLLLDSPMNQDSSIQREPSPIGRMRQRPREEVLRIMIVQKIWSKLLLMAH
ncbi:unnamed protein product [Prunus armeniaca]